MNFGFLAFTDVEELDLIGPWEIIGMWGKFFDGPQNRVMIGQKKEPIICAKGLKIIPDYTFGDCPDLDFLLIPGGQGTRIEVGNPELIHFVQRQAKECKKILSVCTGAFILKAAGLLEGKTATSHWGSLNRLRQEGGVEVVEKRFVSDGTIWTSAGVSAGIDLALALVADLAGEETAGKVQLAAEYYPSTKRYGSAHLQSEAPAYLREKS